MSTTAEQRRMSLERANEIRFRRAALRRQAAAISSLADSRSFLAELVDEEPEEALRGVPIGKFLIWARGIGKRRAVGAYLHVIGCSSDRPLGDLTTRQRQLLAATLRSTTGSYPDLITAVLAYEDGR